MKGRKVSRQQIMENGATMLLILRKCGFSESAIEILSNDLHLMAQSWSFHNKFRKGAGLICPVITPAYSSLPDSIERLSFKAFGYSKESSVQLNFRPETATSLDQNSSKLPHWLINLPDPSYTKGLHPENAGRKIAKREAPKGSLKVAPLGINTYGFLNMEELIFWTAFYGTLGKYSYCAKAGRLAGSFESYPMIMLNAAGQVEVRNENPTSLKNTAYPFCFSRSLGANT